MRTLVRSCALTVSAAVVCSIAAHGVAAAQEPSAGPVVAPTTQGSFAGYSAAFDGDKVRLVATVVIPTLHCDPEVEEGIVTSVELTSEDGPLPAAVEFHSYCHFGDRMQWIWYNTDMGVISTQSEVVDGDRITASLLAIGNSGDIEMTVTNRTRGWSETVETTGPAADSAVVAQYHLNWLTEDPLILSENTKVQHVRLSGADLASMDPVRHELTRDGPVLMRAGKIKNGTDFTFHYVGPKLAEEVGSNSGTAAHTAEPVRVRPSTTSADGFRAYRRPVRAYTGRRTCAYDLSDSEDGALINTMYDEDCPNQVNFSPPMTKHSVPDGGWITWGEPPFTENPTPDVISTNQTEVRLDFFWGSREAVGFEIEPDLYEKHSFTATFFSKVQGAGTPLGSITRTVSGRGGARLLAASAPEGIRSVEITSNDGVGFALAQIRS